MSVFDDVVGQERVVAILRRAVAGAGARLLGQVADGMTHAWLLTGPPGSGRSNAARAFAAALQCDAGGDGTCRACRTALAGTSAEVEVVATSQLSIGVDVARALVARAALAPAAGRWQVIIIEDADRLTEAAANVLLKALEEPTRRTVWVLCAPALEDVLVTVRSRCRHLSLRTPPVAAVTEVLITRDGVDPAVAAFAARAAQGHIGRARRLAVDEEARLRRHAALQVPESLQGVPQCLAAAAALVEAALEESVAATAAADERETDLLSRALGAGAVGRSAPAGAAAQLKELDKSHKARAKRAQRDAVDRALTDLSSFYRDVLTLQLGAGVDLVNEELRPALAGLAARSTPEQSLRRLDAILACRQAIDANVALLLAVEAMTIELRTA